MDTRTPQTTLAQRRRTNRKTKPAGAAVAKPQAARTTTAHKAEATTGRSTAAAETTTRRVARARTSGTSAGANSAEPVWGPTARTEFLLGTFAGVTELAQLLGVSKSQPTRWRQGSERPSPAVARRLVDLEHVWARALQLWDEKTARVWLQSPNAFLDGARPIDVLELRGASEVIDALDATFSGAFA